MGSTNVQKPDRDEGNTVLAFDHGERFTRLIVANRPRIYGFIYSLVHDRGAAEDILQEVSAVMWRKFEQFESGSNFTAWALKIARYSVLEWRRKAAKTPIPLEDEVAEALAEHSAEMALQYDDMRETLRHCLSKLPPRQTDIIRARYFEDEAVRSIATRLRRTRMAIYKTLKKAHESLLNCIERRNAINLNAD